MFGFTSGTSSISNLGLEGGEVTGAYYVGGLGGVNNGGSITTSYATGAVTGSGAFVGGLVGINGGSITTTYTTGEVTGMIRVGGLVGNNGGSITTSYATGEVNGNRLLGGLVGLNINGSITSCYWDTETSGQVSSDGGAPLSSADMLLQASFAGFTFDASNWVIVEGVTRPYLAWQDVVNAITITPATTGPTSAENISFTIAFDKPVVGFDSFADLAVTTSGTAAAGGATFAGSGASYTVTLTGIGGDGTLALGVVPGSNVQDAFGQPLASSVTSTMVAIDNTAPAITAPDDITIECTSPSGESVNLGTPVVTDAQDNNPGVSNDAPATFPLGTTIVTWTATDSSGNQATAMQSVTITDTTAPAITAPDDITIECTSPSGENVSLGTPVVTDACDNNPSVSDDAPATFPLGTTTVTWTATDASGNSAQDTQLVIVQDTTAPVITLVGDAITSLYVGGTFADPGASVTDGCDGSVQLVTGGDSVDPGTAGTYLLTYDATDATGNQAVQVTRTVRVVRPVTYVKHDAGGSGDGSDWTNAFTSLQDAIADSFERTAAHWGLRQEIWVAAGTYFPDEGEFEVDDARSSTFRLKTGVPIYGGFAGSETTLADRAPSQHLTVLSGDLDQDDNGSPDDGNARHIVTAIDIIGSAVFDRGEVLIETTLDGFTITGGNADGAAAPDNAGGGILAEGGNSPQFVNCVLTGNTAVNGGALFCVDSRTRVQYCTFTGNAATDKGGAIYTIRTGSVAHGGYILDAVMLTDNVAVDG
ncbi:MAG: DUF5011 domain-containing protein, partial [bacterium]|nr:DUF5011 domain-containing protein [bacterium]